MGLAASAAAGGLHHVTGARMRFYSQPWLLVPTHAATALCVSWLAVLWRLQRARVGAVPLRGWWGARALMGAVMLGWAVLLALCAVKGLRSGFQPLQWTLLLGVTARLHHYSGGREGARAAWWAAGCLVPLLQTWYLAYNVLLMFVPVTGRSGTSPLPPDVTIGVVASSMALAGCSWLLPLVAVTRGAGAIVRGAALAAALFILSTLPPSPLAALFPPYSAERPQRYMVFHTRVSMHAARGGGGATHRDLYWMPHLDANTPHSLRGHVDQLAEATFDADACVQWPYCGAPYYLPVVSLITRGYAAAAPQPPGVNVTVSATTEPLNATTQLLTLHIRGPSHVVAIVSPAAGSAVSWSDALDGPLQPAAPWGVRATYFLAMHDARAEGEGGATEWSINLHISHTFPSPPEQWATLSVAGHAMGRPRADVHEALLARFPPWTVTTGWGVHLHLLHV